MSKSSAIEQRRKRLYSIVETGNVGDIWSRGYDILLVAAILINLAVCVAYTFDEMELKYGPELLAVEFVTVSFFAVDYVLRLWTAKYQYPDQREGRALWKYVSSITGIIDLASFLPYFLPVFFPAGAVAFRMFRVVRIFRLFRINAYYDSLSVITSVLSPTCGPACPHPC